MSVTLTKRADFDFKEIIFFSNIHPLPILPFKFLSLKIFFHHWEKLTTPRDYNLVPFVKENFGQATSLQTAQMSNWNFKFINLFQTWTYLCTLHKYKKKNWYNCSTNALINLQLSWKRCYSFQSLNAFQLLLERSSYEYGLRSWKVIYTWFRYVSTFHLKTTITSSIQSAVSITKKHLKYFN